MTESFMCPSPSTLSVSEGGADANCLMRASSMLNAVPEHDPEKHALGL
jgi:hypothetical protein